jgi:hypothetical protein
LLYSFDGGDSFDVEDFLLVVIFFVGNDSFAYSSSLDSDGFGCCHNGEIVS